MLLCWESHGARVGLVLLRVRSVWSRVWRLIRLLWSLPPGTPCYTDSEGVVRLLNRSLGNTWVPVCNTRDSCKGKSDHYWVVGVHEHPQQLR